MNTTYLARPLLIGLTGYAGCGKDTVRGMMEEAHDYIGFAFADPIREMLFKLLSNNHIDLRYMTDRALKETIIPELGVSYRHMAQTLGTEWGRSLQDDFWLRLAGAYMGDLQNDTFTDLHFVISDVRFQNEAAWVRQRGGVIWHVTRADTPRVRAHISESEIDSITYDHVILNNGTLADLRATVEQALRVQP